MPSSLGLQLRGLTDCCSALDAIVINGQKGFWFFQGVLVHVVVLDSRRPSLLRANDGAGGVVRLAKKRAT